MKKKNSVFAPGCILMAVCLTGCGAVSTPKTGNDTSLTAASESQESAAAVTEADSAETADTADTANTKTTADTGAADSLAPAGDGMTSGTALPAGSTLDDAALSEMSDLLNGETYHGFVMSCYEDVRDADLDEVFYVGAGIEGANDSLTAEQEKEYLKESGYDEITIDLTHVTEAQMDEVLMETTGYTYQDFLDAQNTTFDWVYLPDSKLYAYEHGDTNMTPITVTSGEVDAEGYYELHYKGTYDTDDYGLEPGILTLSVNGDAIHVIRNEKDPEAQSK